MDTQELPSAEPLPVVDEPMREPVEPEPATYGTVPPTEDACSAPKPVEPAGGLEYMQVGPGLDYACCIYKGGCLWICFHSS